MDKKMQMIGRVRGMMEERNINQTKLAGLIGIKQGSFSEFLSGKIDRPRFLPELAAALGTSVEYLVAGEETPKGRKSSSFVPPALPGHTLIRVLPVHGSVSAANGTIYGLADPDGSRKLYLDVPEDCYAVEVSGDSMEPRYQHGDKVLIHPSQTITKGMDVLIKLPDGEGMIKTFVREKSGVITYRQYSPKEQDKTIKRADIEGMHAVICRWG